jgi:hypothetical protein
MVDDPKQNYFLKSNDLIGNDTIIVADDEEIYNVEIQNGNVASVSSENDEQFDIDEINARLAAGSDLGEALSGEKTMKESIRNLIKESITEVVIAEYKKRKLSENKRIKKMLLPLIKEVLEEEAPETSMITIYFQDGKLGDDSKKVAIPLKLKGPADHSGDEMEEFKGKINKFSILLRKKKKIPSTYVPVGYQSGRGRIIPLSITPTAGQSIARDSTGRM